MSGDFENCYFGKQAALSERSALLAEEALRLKTLLEDLSWRNSCIFLRKIYFEAKRSIEFIFLKSIIEFVPQIIK